MHASWVRMWIGSLWVGLIWIAGAIVPDEGARTAIWIAALPLSPRIGRTAGDCPSLP
jgi:hypothetical protein